MKKNIIENAESFLAALEKANYIVVEKENYSFSFNIKRGDLELSVKPEYKGETWSRHKPHVGFLIRKPYFLIKNHERANSGQIMIKFHKSSVEDVLLKIEEMFNAIEAYNIQQNKKRDLVAIATGFLTAESVKWEKTKADYPRGFRLITDADSKNPTIQQLKALGVNEVYYSYSDKKFIFCPISVPYSIQICTNYSYVSTYENIDANSIVKKANVYLTIQSLIDKLNV